MNLTKKLFIICIICLCFISITSADIVDFTNLTDNTSAIYGLAVTFNSTTPTDPITSRVWDFGDNYTGTEVNPTHYYSVAGRYNVSGSFVNSTGTTIVNKTWFVNLTSDANSGLRSWMRFNGPNGGTVFVDMAGLAWTPSSVTTSTTQYKFGNASALFNSDTDSLSTPASTVTNITGGNFTIEMWVYPTSISTADLILSKSTTTLSNGWGIYHPTGTGSTNWRFFWGGLANQTSPFTLPLNQWSHLAIIRTGNTLNVYINGNRTTSSTMSGSYDTVNPLTFGNKFGDPDSFGGYIDEFRISSTARWETNFSTPTVQYMGNIFVTYPDINPDSTLRFKTDSVEVAVIANASRNGVRNRTIQLQNVNNATYLVGTMTFNPENLYVRNIYPNTSYYSDISIVSYNANHETGVLEYNITRPSGFSNGVNRASVLDTEILYWNYTPFPTSSLSFFGEGFLINGSTGLTYPVTNFIETVLTYGGWTTFSNFTVVNKTPIVFETPVTFIPELNYTANRFIWEFGDGDTFTSYNGSVSHIYNTPGYKHVTLTAYIWQNESVTNTTIFTYAVNASYNASYISTDFTSNTTSGYTPYLVQFNDTSVVSPDHWAWDFGDGTFSSIQNPTHWYNISGVYTVTLTSSNLENMDIETKTGYIHVSTYYPKSDTSRRGIDIVSYVYIGALLIVVTIITAAIIKRFEYE